MTVKEILNTLEKAECDWDQLCPANCEEKIADKLPEKSYKWIKYGISKMAILFNECNFVIKIPFAGWGKDDDDRYISEFVFNPFYNANDVEGHEWDYCYTETRTIQKVLDYDNKHDTHIIQLFAKTEYVGNIDISPIYIQPCCIPMEDFDKDLLKPRTPASKKAAKKIYSKYKGVSDLPLEWCDDVVIWYGQEVLEDLYNFLKYTPIGDFHEGNIGYTNEGAPIIIDYADYFDD